MLPLCCRRSACLRNHNGVSKHHPSVNDHRRSLLSSLALRSPSSLGQTHARKGGGGGVVGLDASHANALALLPCNVDPVVRFVRRAAIHLLAMACIARIIRAHWMRDETCVSWWAKESMESSEGGSLGIHARRHPIRFPLSFGMPSQTTRTLDHCDGDRILASAMRNCI